MSFFFIESYTKNIKMFRRRWKTDSIRKLEWSRGLLFLFLKNYSIVRVSSCPIYWKLNISNFYLHKGWNTTVLGKMYSWLHTLIFFILVPIYKRFDNDLFISSALLIRSAFGIANLKKPSQIHLWSVFPCWPVYHLWSARRKTS